MVDPNKFTKDATAHSIEVIDGWRVLRFCRRMGYGEECYKRLRNAAFNWGFESRDRKRLMGIIPVAVQQNARHSGKHTTKGLLATFTEVRFPRPFPSLFVVNPVYVVKEISNMKDNVNMSVLSSTSYATLKGHLLAGEERVTVIWRNGIGNEVDIDILS
jgi:uncharacterized protein (UPF0548 family)